MKLLFSGIYLNEEHWLQMRAEVIAKAPEEACGLLAGVGNRVTSILPITNILHDPYRFRMDPEEELKAFLLIDESSLDLLAIYHSHPTGIDRPSQTDINELAFPGIIYIIWFQGESDWTCRGYLMEAEAGIGEVPVIVTKAK